MNKFAARSSSSRVTFTAHSLDLLRILTKQGIVQALCLDMITLYSDGMDGRALLKFHTD